MSFIILDRDGVINFDSDVYIKSPDEWIPIPGSLEAIAYLNRAGYRVLIATNQSGISRGLFTMETLDAIHEKMLRQLAAVGGTIEEIFFCPHQPSDECGCRKPKPGLFHQIQQKYPVHFPDTYFVGDNVTDMQLANNIGCKPFLVLTGKGQTAVEKYPDLPHASNLAEAVNVMLRMP